MKKAILFSVIFLFGILSCDTGTSTPTVPTSSIYAIFLVAPSTQLGDTVTINKYTVMGKNDIDVTTFTHTISTIGTHSISITEDGVTSNSVDVTFDVDFRDSIWITHDDRGTPGNVSDDIYNKYIFNSDVSRMPTYMALNDPEFWMTDLVCAVLNENIKI